MMTFLEWCKEREYINEAIVNVADIENQIVQSLNFLVGVKWHAAGKNEHPNRIVVSTEYMDGTQYNRPNDEVYFEFEGAIKNPNNLQTYDASKGDQSVKIIVAPFYCIYRRKHSQERPQAKKYAGDVFNTPYEVAKWAEVAIEKFRKGWDEGGDDKEPQPTAPSPRGSAVMV
jgi:hypothetical protein